MACYKMEQIEVGIPTIVHLLKIKAPQTAPFGPATLIVSQLSWIEIRFHGA